MNFSDLSQVKAAALLGVAPRTLRDWADAPRNDNGRYDWPQLRDWWARKFHGTGGALDPVQERARKDKELADATALKNAVTRGELIYEYQVADTLNSMAAHMSAQLDSLPGRVANELAGMSDASEIRALLLRETRAIRSSMAEHVGKLADAAERAAG